MAGNLDSRTITVPSIVSYFSDEELNSEYHAKAEYEQAIEKYGTIYKILDLNNAGMSGQDMQEFVREWIRKHYFDGVLSFTVKGVDLHLLGYDKDKLCVGDRIPVEFLDVYKTPVTKVLTCLSAQYDILNPGNSTYKIGIPDVSMDVKLPNKNRGSSVGKKSSSYSSSGGAGVGNLYKWYKELDTKAQIQAEEIEFLAQNISLHADNIDSVTNGIEGVQQSAIIQNEGEVVNVVGSFDVKTNYYGDWPEWDDKYFVKGNFYKKGARVSSANGTIGYICIQDLPTNEFIELTDTRYWLKSTGRKAVIFKDGAQAVLDDVNGQQVSVGTKFGEHDEQIDGVTHKVETFEGSALWEQRDKITGVVGEYEVVLDPVTGVKTLVIKSGGGLRIRRNNTDFGVYDENSLTAGIMVDRINSRNWPAWVAGTDYAVGDKVTILGVGYICNESHHATSPVDMTKWTYSTSTKIKGDVIDIEARQVRIGSTSTVEAWMTDTDQNIDDLEGIVADKATIAQLNTQKARIDNIFADYITSTNIKSTLGNIDLLSVKSLDVGGQLRVVGDQSSSRTVTFGDYVITNIKYPNTYTYEGTSIDIRKALYDVKKEVDGDTITLVFKTLYGQQSQEKRVSFNRATSVTVTGDWSGTTYTVSGASNPLSTTVYLESATGLLQSQMVAKIFHDNPSDNQNLVTSKTFNLVEHVNTKSVSLDYIDSETGETINKASISTSDTYTAGVTDATPGVDDFQISSPPSVSPSYTAGGTNLTRWVSPVGNAVENARYLYFDVWSRKNPDVKKRYYIKF